MWVVILANNDELQYFGKKLKNSHESLQTASGLRALRNQEGQGCHFVAAPPPETSIESLLDWVNLQLVPSALITSSLVAPSADVPATSTFLPRLCLRATGRTEIGGGPLLYEEIPFDPELRDKLAARHQINATNHLEDKIFSVLKRVEDATEIDWVWRHLQCRVIDHYSAEVLRRGQAIGIPVACLKIWGEGSSGLERLFAIWK